MVSGTQWPEGDPFLQRQNEPSIAVSSRNPSHLLAGSNDYRTVDFPGLPAGETGDAWLGVFKSYDAGQTWRSTVHPGCPQKVDQCDGAPALKGYAAGADPVVRAGANGMFYFSGIAFTRDTPKKSVAFVSRFIDNNNEENGDPIKYVSTVPVDVGSGGVFVDKPWLAVDIPRAGAGTCQITPAQVNGTPLTQKFAAGNVYLAYTAFTDEKKAPSRIQFARSVDCGGTWSKPITIGDISLNQGATLAIDPATGAVYVAWRRFKSTSFTDAVLFVKSTDGGQTFTSPLEVAAIPPFDQATSLYSFRTNGYPTMAVDGSGRIYLAWSERGAGDPASAGDARVVLAISRDGQNWTQRAPVADFPARGHQLMPAMTFGGGKLMIVFYDLRLDSTVGNFTAMGSGQYREARVPAGDLATAPPHPEKVFTDFLLDAAPAALNEGGLLRRHTIDLYAAQADPGDTPYFSVARISQYIFGSRKGASLIEQLQVNPPNLPLFVQGTAPFLGDYLDVTASPSLVPGDQPGTWKFNTDPSKSIAFHTVWTDNRDVRPPANGDWKDYTPPISLSSSGASIFDPSQAQPPCRTGQTGMRNQNIYTARITQGLLVTSPSNTKTLGNLQRAFPVTVTNSTNRTRTYRLTIANQPRGGKASFLQGPVAGLADPLTVLDVNVAPISSISRMVFVRSTDPLAAVKVSVDEIAAVGAAAPIPGGLQGGILLNPDPANPDNAALSKAELFNPDIANPDIANPDIANPDIANPDIANPDIANPDIANPDIANPDIANPDIANPDIANPDIANPDIANPDIANAALSDANWKVTNKGTSTATYSIQFLLNGAIPGSIRTQLIIYKNYKTPVSNGCSLAEETHRVVIANVSNPAFLNQQGLSKLRPIILQRARRGPGKALVDSPDSVSQITDDSLGNATVSIAPGESIEVALRFFNPDASRPLAFDPGQALTLVTISHTANTGSTQPSVAASHLIVATAALPAGVAGSSYEQALVAAGGTQPYTWTVTSGALPPGLSLSPSGEITGTIAPGAAANYTFTVQVTDSSNQPQQGPPQQLSIQVSNVALAFARLAAVGPSGTNVKTGDGITVTATVSNTGSPASSVAPNLAINATGTASADCGGALPVSSGIASGARQIYTFTCGSVSGNGTLTFSAGLTAIDTASGAGISAGPATSNPIAVLGAAPSITASGKSGGQPYASGTWTNQDVIVTFTCTPASGNPSARTVTVTSEGANQSVTSTCTDLAGNSVDGTFSGINIDKTPPQLTALATAGGQPYFGTITSQTVVVTFNCNDPGGSGTATPVQQQTVTSDGVGQTVSATCADLAGNVTNTTYGPVNIARTPPQITAMLTSGNGAYSPGTWSGTPVTVSFQCVPAPGVGVASVTPPITLAAQGANQSATGRCTDIAGNSNQVMVTGINIETSPPTISLLSRPPANAAGWYNSPVTIAWQCADPVGGASVITRTANTEGAGQTITATCTNLAGTSVTASQTVSLDMTPPVISGLASPGAPPSGWNTSPVSVAFNCADALSGVAGGYPIGGTTVASDTNGTSVNGTCRDQAGNVAATTVGPIRIDTTRPFITFQSAVPVNAAGWSNGPVTLTWSCGDSGSGPVSPSMTQVLTVSGGATATCTDVAGNSASNTHTGIRIDTVPPVVTLSSPVDGGPPFTVGDVLVVRYSCLDSSSGVASCTGSFVSGTRLTLSSPGTFAVTVTGADVAGNQATVTHTYTVVSR